jgi:hypothetical protein
MTDHRNVLLAWGTTVTSIAATIDMSKWLTFISAIVLPIVFFAVGKTIDVFVQIYLRRRADEKEQEHKTRRPERRVSSTDDTVR